MCFENLLPHMHTKLLELLEVLINICHTHLRPHFRLMSSIVLDSLQKTMWSTPEGLSVQLFNLRIQAYKAATSWLTTFAEGSGCDLIAERLVKIVLEDVIIRRRDIYLSATQSKNKSKRKHTAMSEASESPFQRELLINKNKELLCKQALKCLQKILNSVGLLLKPQLLRNILSTILENSTQIYEKRAWKESVYNEWTSDVKDLHEKNVEAPRINSPLLTQNICSKESTKESSDTKHSTPESVSTESKPSNSEDDDYIAELQAAFVDELK
ncbi:hypothetical protein AWZ03_007393 [Drosophila navojoa]|uniref:Pre-rRNA-processing protein RIX1 N-terminal domain-containing protein n=1 Tax=Drosophila navojoa TaxID=7232 RepID=A0A484BEG8_DRONA|nr:hypothetical protein AWZ03_007393 [Drosophila navojoa]